jgi:hypothetical protein
MVMFCGHLPVIPPTTICNRAGSLLTTSFAVGAVKDTFLKIEIEIESLSQWLHRMK